MMLNGQPGHVSLIVTFKQRFGGGKGIAMRLSGERAFQGEERASVSACKVQGTAKRPGGDHEGERSKR